MSDLLKDIFDEDNDPFTRGVAAAIFTFCALFIWEAFCAMIALFMSIGSLTFGKALLYVNGFCLGLIVIALGVGAIVTISSVRKEKEEDEDPSVQ